MFFEVVTGKLKSYGVIIEYKIQGKAERNVHVQRKEEKTCTEKKERWKHKKVEKE